MLIAADLLQASYHELEIIHFQFHSFSESPSRFDPTKL